MTLPEALRILGLGPEEDPLAHLQEFREARKRIAELVATAPNPTLAARYQRGLNEFDQAVAVISPNEGITPTLPQVAPPVVSPPTVAPPTVAPPTVAPPTVAPPTIKAPVIAAPVVTPPAAPVLGEVPVAEPATAPRKNKPTEIPPIPQPAPTVKLGEVPRARRPGDTPTLPATQPTPATEPLPEPKPAATTTLDPSSPPTPTEDLAAEPPSRSLSIFAWFCILVIAASGATWIYLRHKASELEALQTRVAFLEREGSIFIENRRWQEARASFDEIDQLIPGSQTALLGRRSIEAGMAEEQTQFIGYWTGQAIAELDAGRLDEATSAAQQVLERFPNHQEARQIINRIKTARDSQSRLQLLTEARALLDDREWEKAIAAARRVLAFAPKDADASSIIADATAAIERLAANRARAGELLKQASQRDSGQFDQQALDLLREAASLDPENAAVSALLEKLSAYTRTFRVPGDFATPTEALSQARDQDRIILGPQTWKGPLFVNAAVVLQGADPTKTTVQCTPDEGSAITIGPASKGARISGITFRHEAFAVGTDRFSVALVRGGSADFVDCRFTEASGHGLAVMESGRATADRCRFSDNGWNGATAFGSGTSLDVKNSEARNNFEHGIETWDGATATLVNNRCEANSRNGIHTDNHSAPATLTGNQLIANREFGLVLDSAGSGTISGNTAQGNLLGGFVIRKDAASVAFTRNDAKQNQGSGIILEKGLAASSYTGNTTQENANPQILADADLNPHEPVAKEASKPDRAPPAALPEEP